MLQNRHDPTHLQSVVPAVTRLSTTLTHRQLLNERITDQVGRWVGGTFSDTARLLFQSVCRNASPAAPVPTMKLQAGSLILFFIRASAISERDVVYPEVDQLLLHDDGPCHHDPGPTNYRNSQNPHD